MWQQIQDYLAYQMSLKRSPATLKSAKERLSSFRLFLKEIKDIKEIRNVTLGHCRAWHDWLIERKLKTGSRIGYLSTLTIFLRWAYQHKLILTDISLKIELPDKEETLPPTALTQEEISKVFDCVKTTTIAGKRHRAILELLYACGLRKEELLNLNIGDIDFTEQTVFVKSGKGNKDRIVPCHSAALDAVGKYLEDRGGKPKKKSPLFLNHGIREGEGKRMDSGSLSAFSWKLNKRFKIRHVHPHLFRHTFALHLLQGGADIRYVQALLGHESPDTSSRYLGLVKKDIKDAYDRAMERLFAEMAQVE